MKIVKNILLYFLIVSLFTVFTAGITGQFSHEDNLTMYICGSFWGLIWFPVLISRE